MSKALDKFTHDLLERVGEGLTSLLSTDIHFAPGELQPFTAASLKPFGDEFVAVLSATVSEPLPGTVYAAFDLKRVVVLGALLEMVPPEGIKERLVAPTFSEDHADAFEEVGNILIGKLDEVIRDHVGQSKIHTKKSDTLHGPPAEVIPAIQEQGDYYCLASTLEIAEQESAPVAFLLHPTLVEDGFQADPEVAPVSVAVPVREAQDAPPADPTLAKSTAETTAPAESVGDTVEPAATSVDADPASSLPQEDAHGGAAASSVAEALLAEALRSEPTLSSSVLDRYPALAAVAQPPPANPERTILLVVDDDITTRAMIRQYLEGPDISIFEAVSWREAGLFLRSHRVDAILLDLYLSDLNGIDACRKLHLHPSTRHVPVVLCTSRPSREAVVKGLKAGATDFLIKPFSRARLIEKLDSVRRVAATAA